jgi:hypothetical protein
MKEHIGMIEAAHLAEELAKPGPVQLQAATENQEPPLSPVLQPRQNSIEERKPPPRVRKPRPRNDQCFAPTTDLDKARKCLRETFGNSMSHEFVDVMLGKLIKGLRPGLWDALPEATLNAALAIVNSLEPESEHQAEMAVQYAILAHNGPNVLQLSLRHLMREYVELYGNYAIKLFRAQNELLRTYDRHKRGYRHTMEVQHVHIYLGDPNVLNVANAPSAAGSNP